MCMIKSGNRAEPGVMMPALESRWREVGGSLVPCQPGHIVCCCGAGEQGLEHREIATLYTVLVNVL